MATSASTPTGARVGRPDGGLWQFPPSGLPTLAPVGVEADVAIEGEVAAGQAEDLGPSPSGEEQGEEDGPVAQTNSGGRDGGQELLHVEGRESTWGRGGGPGSLQPIAGIPVHDLHPHEEPEEGADAGHAGTNGYGGGVFAGEAGGVGPYEDVLSGDLIRGLAQPSEEVLEHEGVALDRALGAGAALLLYWEGHEGTLPADEVFQGVGDGGGAHGDLLHWVTPCSLLGGGSQQQKQGMLQKDPRPRTVDHLG